MAMMIDAGFNKSFRRTMWAEAMTTASFLGDIFPTARSNVCAYELFHEKRNAWYEYLIEFGRIGIVTNKNKNKKLEPPGKSMIMVGYALQHKPGTYRMYNPETRRIVVCDNISWTTAKQWKASGDMKDFLSYEENMMKSNPTSMDIDTTQDMDQLPDNTPVIVNDLSDSFDRKTVITPSPTKPRRMLRELETSYNNLNDARVTGITTVQPIRITRSQATANVMVPTFFDEPTAVLETEDEVGRLVEQHIHFCYNTAVQSDPGEPKTFRQAMESDEAKWWKLAVTSEINNFLKRDAWKFVKKTEAMNKGRRLIPTKHVFKKKIELDPKTGKEYVRYKDRIVTLGFMQIPGVDYTESFSPVATDTAIRILLGLTLFYESKGWVCHSYDVEAAFLEPKVDDLEMYLEIPQGVMELGFLTQEEAHTNCILLMNSMYGNVDAALRWILLKTEFLTSNLVGMIQSRSDPCVFYKRDEEGEAMLVIAMTVDDCAVAGTPESIEWLMKKIESRFKITRGGELRKHLGIDYIWKKDNDDAKHIEVWMERKRQDIVDSYEKLIKKVVKVRKTPAPPGLVLRKSDEDEPHDITNYRSLVGKVMFYATKICPKIVNATRELATHMSNPNKEHWKFMDHLIGYIKGTIGKPSMILRKPIELRCVSFVDASYGNSAEGRRSVSGEMHTVGGMISAFSSRSQRTVSLSSTESEYIAAGSAVQEMMFQQSLLSEMAENVYPGVVFEDNAGAIFLSKNKQVGQRTKHIDIRYHFLRDFMDKKKETCGNGIMMKVDGKENYADLMTKNVDGRTFEYLGNDIDDGLKRFREDEYELKVNQQLGGMSRCESLEVIDDVSMLDNWIRHVKKKRKLNDVCEINDVVKN